MASSTGTLSVTFSADPQSAPAASSTGAFSATFAADPASVAAAAADSTSTGTITFSADPSSAPAASSTGTFSATFACEPVSDPGDQAIELVGFGGQVVIETASGVRLSFGYNDKMQAENLERRVTTTETLDTGVYVYDGGFFHAGREMSLVIERPSRSQIDSAKAIIYTGLVAISSWDGYYSGYATNLVASADQLQLDVVVANKVI